MDLDIRHWSIITWLITLIAGSGAVVLQTKSNTKKLDDIDRKIDHVENEVELIDNSIDNKISIIRVEFGKKLYKDDGETLYMPRASCENCRVQCQMDRLKAYEELKRANHELKVEIKEVVLEMQKISGCLHELSGAVKQFMKGHGN